jgi:phosphopantetheinyl transferase
LDIEPIPADVDLCSLSKVLTDSETMMLERFSGQERADKLASIWTAKEAAAKACGTGLAADFRQLLLRPTRDGVQDSGSAGDWTVWQTRLEPEHYLADATQRQVIPVLHWLSAEELVAAIEDPA